MISMVADTPNEWAIITRELTVRTAAIKSHPAYATCLILCIPRPRSHCMPLKNLDLHSATLLVAASTSRFSQSDARLLCCSCSARSFGWGGVRRRGLRFACAGAALAPWGPAGLDSGGTARIQKGRRHCAKAEGAGQQAAGVASSES
uniref:Uncharacterized protein n=1 Tax=Zea mays TaxID=4577 RepID=C0PHR5_MAIZE|nr:unknown [Zea mays]